MLSQFRKYIEVLITRIQDLKQTKYPPVLDLNRYYISFNKLMFLCAFYPHKHVPFKREVRPSQ